MRNSKESVYKIASYFHHLWADEVVRDEDGEIDVAATDAAALEANKGRYVSSNHTEFTWGDSTASNRYEWTVQPFSGHITLTINRAVENCPIPSDMEQYFAPMNSKECPLPVLVLHMHYDKEYTQIKGLHLVSSPFAEPRHYTYLTEMVYALLGDRWPSEELKSEMRKGFKPTGKTWFEVKEKLVDEIEELVSHQKRWTRLLFLD